MIVRHGDTDLKTHLALLCQHRETRGCTYCHPWLSFFVNLITYGVFHLVQVQYRFRTVSKQWIVWRCSSFDAFVERYQFTKLLDRLLFSHSLFNELHLPSSFIYNTGLVGGNCIKCPRTSTSSSYFGRLQNAHRYPRSRYEKMQREQNVNIQPSSILLLGQVSRLSGAVGRIKTSCSSWSPVHLISSFD